MLGRADAFPFSCLNSSFLPTRPLISLARCDRVNHRTHGEQAFVGSGNLHPEDAELKRLRRENEILRQERDSFKKALAIFSHP